MAKRRRPEHEPPTHEREDDRPLTAEASIQDTIDWVKWALNIEDDQRKSEQEALAFQDAEGAWPADVKAFRGATTVAGIPLPPRPMISVASLDEPLGLQESFERTASIGVRIHALTEEASDDTAEVLQGIYRSIERDSHAKLARRWGYDRGLKCGRGAYRVDKVYDADGGHPLDQKIVLRRILYQSNVIFDPTAQQPDFSDGLRTVIIDDVPWETYKRRYKKSRLARATVDELSEIATDDSQGWIRHASENDKNTKIIRIAEEWTVEVDTAAQVLLDNGEVSDANAIPEGRKKHPTDKRPIPDREVRKVYWRTINAVEELEPKQEWDGQWIPIIPVIGRELQPIHGHRRWFGMIQNARGAVRMVNYAASGAVEMSALEPRMPIKAAAGSFEGFKEYIENLNTRNIPVLYYNTRGLDGQPIPPPERLPTDASKLGPNMALLQMGQGFVQTATATHPPALGEDTPAFRSGKAINALQSQSVQANSPYLGNLADISMMYEARVILDLIPHVYDRPGRIARALGRDGKSQAVMLNHPFQMRDGRPQKMPWHIANGSPLTAAQQSANALTQTQVEDPNHPATYHNLNEGRYGVEVTIGKSYADERQEGATEMGMILQSDPQMMLIVGPEYFKHRGEPWADEVGALLQKQRDHTMPWLSSQQQQQGNAQQLAAENMMLKQQLGMAAQEKAGKVIENQGKMQIEEMKQGAEMVRSREANEVKLAVAELSAKVDKLELFLEESRLVGERGHDMAMGAADAHAQQLSDANAAALSQQEHQQTMQQQTLAGAQQAALGVQQNAMNPPQAGNDES
jgi:hypothetical protein